MFSTKGHFYNFNLNMHRIRLLLVVFLVGATNLLSAQESSDIFTKAQELLVSIQSDEAGHHHGNNHGLIEEAELIEVNVADTSVQFVLSFPINELEENFDEHIFEELALLLFNEVAAESDLNTFSLYTLNRDGEKVSIDEFNPRILDVPYVSGPGDGGADIFSSNDLTAARNPVLGQGQSTGALSGKTVWLSPGHGWLYYNSLNAYSTQRGETNDMVEDFGSIEGINYYLLKYLWNAGANVWSVRERDVNTNEVIVDNQDAGYSETGTWSTTSNTGFNPSTNNFDQSNGYRFSAVTSGAANSSATWAANIPKEGYYWVSVAYRSSSDRPIDAQFEVNHAGGTTAISVNQEVHGETWVYLGQFYFDAGNNASVKLLNSTTDPATSQFVIADAVRFGGGTGTEIDCSNPSVGNTGKPRFEESARMFAPFQGYPTCRSDVTMRPFYAEWELSKGTAQEQANAIYVSWHTNASAAGTARGTITYAHDTAPTPNSYSLQSYVHNHLAGDIISCWDGAWNDRGLGYANFGEVRELTTMPGCLIEVAFHDNATDAQALTTPDFRELAARSIYHGIVDFFANQDNISPAYMPSQPTHLYAKNSAAGEITLTWQAPNADCDADPATGYKIYSGTHGKGFNDGIAVSGNSYTFTGLNPNTTYYFRVSGTNTGGESFPTATVAARTPASGFSPTALIVDGFDRMDRASAVLKTSSSQLTDLKRLFLELMNSYDYMVDHAKSMESCNVSFDGVANEAVISGAALLSDYAIVNWYTGEESTVDNSLDATERSLVQSYLDNQGCLIISGAEIGWDIGRAASPNAAVSFYNNYLKAVYVGDDAATYNFAGTSGGIFSGISGSFDDNSNCYFDAEYPDRLAATGGSTVDLLYTGGTADGAAVSYQGSDFSVVYFGFPLETVSAGIRDNLICEAINFVSTNHDLCLASGNSSNNEWIDGFQFADINNYSGSDAGYGDYTGLATLTLKSFNYVASLAPGYSGTAIPQNWAVFIDYNQDGDFDDAGERALDKLGVVGSEFGIINIPVTASTGQTSCRVIMKRESAGPIVDACETFANGEVEDYTVYIGNAATSSDCLSVHQAFAVVTGSTSTYLYWTPMPLANGYKVFYRALGTTPVTIVNVTNWFTTINGLNPNTTYEYAVRAICEGQTPGSLSIKTFTTNGTGDPIFRANEEEDIPTNSLMEESIIKLYPNPASDFVILEGTVNSYFENVKILDESGKILKDIPCRSNQAKIDLSDLSNALYFIEVFDKEGKLLINEKVILHR